MASFMSVQNKQKIYQQKSELNAMHEFHMHLHIAFSVRSVRAHGATELFLSSMNGNMLLQIALPVRAKKRLLTKRAGSRVR